MAFPFPLSFQWVLAPFLVQGILLLFDEFHYHRRRRLPDWERVGHPLDTLTVLVPLLALPFVSPGSPAATGALAFGALFSCVFIAKDEGVHLKHSTPGEQRLHAGLFMVHPLLFLAMAMLWMPLHGFGGESVVARARTYWAAEALLVTGFLGWQVYRWKPHEVLAKGLRIRGRSGRSAG